jgi:hypothetical protein
MALRLSVNDHVVLFGDKTGLAGLKGLAGLEGLAAIEPFSGMRNERNTV